MAKVKIEVEGYRCERCGHEWILCPKCKSAYWDKPRKNKKQR